MGEPNTTLQKHNKHQAHESKTKTQKLLPLASRPVVGEDVPPLLPGVQSLDVLQGTVGSCREVGIAGGQQIEHARVKIDVLQKHLLVAFGRGALQGVHGPGLAGSARREELPHHGQREVPAVVDALVLALFISHGELFRHLAHKDRGPNVPGVHLHILAAHSLHDVQALGVAVATAGRAVDKGGRQIVGHGLVHFLICAVLIRFEDDGDLQKEREAKKINGPRVCSNSNY
uniref:Uncharacterized protein n=1 Tax=Podarcis muralis TaxID=64176 RepID=A0A670JDG7_PODMU